MSGRLVVVGDALLDRDLDGTAARLAPDAPVPVLDDVEDRPRPGGAGLAAALAAAGGPVTLVTALGRDRAGRRLAELLDAAGVEVHDLGLEGQTPEKIRVRAGDRPLVRLDHGGTGAPCGPAGGAVRDILAAADAVLVSDYGRGVTAEPTVRDALAGRPGDTPLLWDPHPRGPEPVPGAVLVTPNAAEAGVEPVDLSAVAARGRELAARWRAVAVAITLSERGALLTRGEGTPLAVPAPAVAAGDPCGAGDCFAATAARRLAAGALPSEAVTAAVDAAARFVAGGGAAGAARRGFAPPEAAGAQDARALARRVRAAGGTVVATGGCFDLLHAGHVGALEAARALGDCLIVCLNSDDSVRRLKGFDRPLVGQSDRARVLGGLGCVDAVAVFDEDEPSRILRDLRPHVWAKGGDYAASELPEARVLAEWDASVVCVPFTAGRSTSLIIDAALTRAG